MGVVWGFERFHRLVDEVEYFGVFSPPAVGGGEITQQDLVAEFVLYSPEGGFHRANVNKILLPRAEGFHNFCEVLLDGNIHRAGD